MGLVGFLYMDMAEYLVVTKAIRSGRLVGLNSA